MHGIVLYCLCITILYKNVTIKKESKIMRNLTKSCIQNCKFVRVLDKYAAVLLGLKESNLAKTSLIIISSTILPSVSSATCQLLKFWHAQKAKFQDNYPPPPPPPLMSPVPFPFSGHLASFNFWWEKVLQKLIRWKVGSARFSLDFLGQLYIILFMVLCIFPYFVWLNWLIQIWFDHMLHLPPSMLIF